MAANYIAMRKRHCIEIEGNAKIVHKWSTNNRQLTTVTIRAPNGELVIRHNLNMAEYRMHEDWRVRFRKADMMPTAVLNPTIYDAQFPFVCGLFQEALPGPHAP
eukprot:5187462-Karenia_brevis.AAC.1